MSEKAKHTTEVGLVTTRRRAVAECSCGWSREVPYVQEGIGSQVAVRMSGILARNHRRDAE